MNNYGLSLLPYFLSWIRNQIPVYEYRTTQRAPGWVDARLAWFQNYLIQDALPFWVIIVSGWAQIIDIIKSVRSYPFNSMRLWIVKFNLWWNYNFWFSCHCLNSSFSQSMKYWSNCSDSIGMTARFTLKLGGLGVESLKSTSCSFLIPLEKLVVQIWI